MDSEVEAGTLYLVPTPLGHLGDLSPRAAGVLRDVDVIAAEDTRTTRALTSHLEIRAPRLVSTHDHNEARRAPELVEGLLSGRSVALVSEAGTPLLSDPGWEVVRLALDAGVRVVPLPGPSAAITALSASGLPLHRALLVGFLPRAEGKRRSALEELRDLPFTLVLYASPHRLERVLEDALAVLGDRPAALAADLTKRHERFYRGRLSQVLEAVRAEDPLRGEWTACLGGAPGERPDPGAVVADRLVEALAATDLPTGAAREVVCRVTGMARSEAYRRLLEARGR